uniref:Serine peptidase inhibitor, Kunitz type, 2 n=2 Tax=Iconisemion striatum TaxID=60296 RepID=A0A1A7YII5_9TELE
MRKSSVGRSDSRVSLHFSLHMMLPKMFLLSFLVQYGSVLGCEWTNPNQGLNMSSLSAGARILGPDIDVLDPENCKAACCSHPDCDLVQVAFPADRTPLCTLVSCMSNGLDVCALQPNSQVRVFRRTLPEARGESPRSGQKLSVVPLQESPETPRSNDTINVLCRLPMKVGPCRAAFPRFFYNVTNQICSGFIYGGCEDNGNNFETQQECEATCSGVTGSVLPEDSTPAPPQLALAQPAAKAPRMAPPEFAAPKSTEPPADQHYELCEVEVKVGPCRASIKRWYFNKEMGSCQTFSYGGCKGNKNNYETEESCKATCAGATVLPSSKKHPDVSSASEHCMLSPDSGPCRAAFPKFYYDPDTNSCKGFVYGGCSGNANNFDSLEDCMKSCSGDGSSDRHGTTRSRWTAAFFLFVTLAVICALLLATLVIITLRRHRLSRRPSSVSDKQELLPDTDELSSLDSVPIPESPKPEQKA